MREDVAAGTIPHRPRAFAPAGPVPAPPPGRSWEGLMELALGEAAAALAGGDVPVGAVVVAPDGTLPARAGNAVERDADPTAHAELLAIRKAARQRKNWRLEGCVLGVTLEPCAMCAAAIVHARLAGVVFGAADEAAGAVVSRAEYLDGPVSRRSVWYMGGVRSEACAALLRRCFQARR
ncbi:nucleoside deaminase [uncultured Desulfovibrio sp.]|uniref:nucleoside deaminase n=1 Tax=uncultured Desulfovibrio sp. TaxID=167968 RepID=UPI0026269B55|nr:nucleoside deaminase [uncultured Desulfovibrio sp.]